MTLNLVHPYFGYAVEGCRTAMQHYLLRRQQVGSANFLFGNLEP